MPPNDARYGSSSDSESFDHGLVLRGNQHIGERELEDGVYENAIINNIEDKREFWVHHSNSSYGTSSVTTVTTETNSPPEERMTETAPLLRKNQQNDDKALDSHAWWKEVNRIWHIFLSDYHNIP